MLFNSFQYWIFFFIVAALFYSVPFRFGKILLLLASYVFYMWWDPRFIVLILTSTVVDYYLGIFLETATGRRKKLLLVVSLVVNLGILGFFKYYDFFAGSLAALLRIPQSSVVLQIVLPVGVSFYTFASLSYTFDVYWGKMKAVQKPDRLRAVHRIFSSSDCRSDHSCPAIHLSNLVIGDARRQLWCRAESSSSSAGLIKKMVFADRFAVVSDSYFNDPTAHPGWLAAWSGCLAFTMQVFFDFSGYTDIARGCAKLLGFEFPLNFARPFLGQKSTRLLAKVAYHTLHVGAGLCVHAIKPGKKRPARVISQHAGCYGARGSVAWSELDVCSLGRIPRPSVNRLPSFRSRNSRNSDR